MQGPGYLKGNKSMKYVSTYCSPLGKILMAADEAGLTGLWFEGQKYYAAGLDGEHKEENLPVFVKTKEWLDIYFSGREPDFTPPLHMVGTDFRRSVWEALLEIPYGETRTYAEIARRINGEKGGTGMAARAVGGAVGHNPVSIIVPCHRVVGSNGSLTGYAGGVEKKIYLLELEKVDVTGLFASVQKTARRNK